MLLKDRVVVITGAGRGIGRGMALLLAAEGAKVVVNDLGTAATGLGSDKGPADTVVEEIRKNGGTAVGNYDTVATMKGGESIIQTAIKHFGRIDILVNNAGILRDRMIFNMSEEEWDTVIAVHLKGHFACTRAAAPLMKQQQYGRIINMTSSSGLRGNVGQANYGAAKAGIAGFTRVCALDLKKYNITVNCIAPAADTRLTMTMPDDVRKAKEASRSPLLLDRDPEDIAPLVVYLASEQASYITGKTFYASKGLISLYSDAKPTNSIIKKGRWTPQELMEIFKSTLGSEM